MTLDLRASTRELVSQSSHCQEVVEFAAWLEAQHYSAFACDLRLRRLRRAVSAPTLPEEGRPARAYATHPHSLRHSTAVALLKAGIDFATISQWLGHAGLNTTMRYAQADIDLKRQAISQVFPNALSPPRGGRMQIDGSDLVGWLRRI